MTITLELTEFELEIVLKALRNEADRDLAHHQMGVGDTLSAVMGKMEALGVAKPVQREISQTSMTGELLLPCRGIPLPDGNFTGCSYGSGDMEPYTGPCDCPVCEGSGFEAGEKETSA